MRNSHGILAVIVSTALAACTEQSLPIFENPQPISVPAGQPAYGPRLSQNSGGSTVLSWMERNDEATLLRFSAYDNGSWRPAVTAVQDDKMFVNWADLPTVTPVGSESLLAHWLSYTADAPYAYQILTAYSGDNGASWSNPASPHTDGTPTEHGFVSTYATTDGTGLLWLDGRNTPDQGMTLRGATVASDGALGDETALDDLVCDCCQTDVALTDIGPIAIYRNRTEEEIRDIYVSRYLADKWQTGTPVSNDGWVISGCPVNGPSIDADGKLVVVAWFTAANNKPKVQTAVSTNSGRSFSEPIEVSSKNVIGHVGITLVDEHSYVVSWMESGADGNYAIKLRGLTTNGQLGPVQIVGRSALARIVPQLVRIGDKLVLAWTDKFDDLNKVVSVEVRIRGFYD